MNYNKKKPILVDMDGVVADFLEGFYQVAEDRYPELYKVLPPPEKLTQFYIEDNIVDSTEELRKMARDIVNDSCIFTGLPVMKDAVEGVKFLQELSGREVFFCSAPHTTNFDSYWQKAAWIKRHFGEEWLNRLLLVRDKTLIDGIILIDDKPNPMGVYNPQWEHIVYHHPFNQLQNEVKGKYRMFGWDEKSVRALVGYINYPSWRK